MLGIWLEENNHKIALSDTRRRCKPNQREYCNEWKIPEKEFWRGCIVRNNRSPCRENIPLNRHILSLPVGKLCNATRHMHRFQYTFFNVPFKAQIGTYLLSFYSLLQDATTFPLIYVDNKTVGGNYLNDFSMKISKPCHFYPC